MGAVGAIEAEVALATLDLAGVPKLVEVAVGDVRVGGAGDDVGGGEAGSASKGAVDGVSEVGESGSGGGTDFAITREGKGGVGGKTGALGDVTSDGDHSIIQNGTSGGGSATKAAADVGANESNVVHAGVDIIDGGIVGAIARHLSSTSRRSINGMSAGHLGASGHAGSKVVAGAGGVLALGGTGEVLELVARAVAPVLEVASELLDVLAGAVATAVVGAGGTAAAAAFVAVEALALASLAVAEALVAAFGVVVSIVSAIGGVSPGESVCAGAEGAVSALEVLVAAALVVRAADAVAGAVLTTTPNAATRASATARL